MSYFTGKGYGVSQYVDVSGVPLLTVTNKSTGKVITAFDRVAVQFDPTVKQVVTLDQIYNARMDLPTSSALKTAVGGTSAQELDHIISLELGGSNQIANLALDTNTPGTKNNPTDTFENQLSAAVQAGSMSLVDAWEQMAAAKSKVLAEDLTMQTSSGWASAASGIWESAKGLVSPAARGTLNTNLKAQIDQDFANLKLQPYNIALRNKIFTEQIQLTKEQLNLSESDAAAYTKVYTAKYAQAKGNDATEILGALTANEQQLIGIAGKTPNLLGIPNTVWSNVAAGATVLAGVSASVGVIALLISVFTGGAADAVAAGAGAGVSGFLAAIGAGGTIGVAAGSFAIAGFLEGLALTIPMITKQMLDASVISPSLISTALNDDIKNIKALSGSSSTKSKSSTVSGGTSSAPHSAPSGNVLISAVSSGVVGSATAFTPRPTDIIESATDLTTAAQNNLSAFLTSLPGILGYDIVLATHVVADDGSIRFGGTNRVVKGYSKKGVAEYKNVTNKFAVLEIFYVPSPRKRVILDKIVLGPIDEGNYAPAEDEIATIVTHLQENFVISAPGTETSPLPPPTSSQYQTSPAQTTTDTTATPQSSTTQAPTLAPSAPAACTATTLAQFYSRQSLSLPSIIARAALYEQYGLGTAATYTGTSEQNAKLLQHLQAALGCFVSTSTASTSAASGVSGAPTAAPAVDASLLPTTAQLAARVNPIQVTVTYPTTGLFINTASFGEAMSKRVGSVVWDLHLIDEPFRSLFPNVIGAGAQAGIVDKWLQDTFGFSVMSLPQFNFADLTTDRSITLHTSFTSPGQPGATVSDPKALVTLFLATNATPAGTTTGVLN